MKSLLWLLLSVQIALGSDYAIVVSEKTAEDKSWAKVVATLRKKHSGKIVHYEKSVREASLRSNAFSTLCLLCRHPS